MENKMSEFRKATFRLAVYFCTINSESAPPMFIIIARDIQAGRISLPEWPASALSVFSSCPTGGYAWEGFRRLAFWAFFFLSEKIRKAG